METDKKVTLHLWEGTNWKSLCEGIAVSLGFPHPNIQRAPDGKPFFAGCPSLFFNVSTTRDHTLAAFAPFPIGIDWEHLDRKVASLSRIANRYFFPKEIEWMQLLGKEEENSRFLHLWTIKESSVKLDGCGLYEGGLCNCQTEIEDASPPRFSLLNQRRIYLHSTRIHDNFFATIAAYHEFLLALPAK